MKSYLLNYGLSLIICLLTLMYYKYFVEVVKDYKLSLLFLLIPALTLIIDRLFSIFLSIISPATQIKVTFVISMVVSWYISYTLCAIISV